TPARSPPEGGHYRLDVEDLNPRLERLDRIAAGRGAVLVRDVAGVAEVDNRLGDEAVVQLLRAVDLVAAGDAGRVEMEDPLDVVFDRRGDVAFHDLRVIDVEKHLHVRRVDALAHLE